LRERTHQCSRVLLEDSRRRELLKHPFIKAHYIMFTSSVSCLLQTYC